ncbi:serine/threonine-protein kinase [Streptomyces sp. NBC_01298]|uniref:WD40 repeat domain-containing serine/threonine protein kinase n=1 Tax=Streptomyces sp. NBC_01298 TaxID=2903817 RepID=UPI002E10E83A|nr:serine/threonine-protein kinase [Streptomyces sp. NBC_01298]
MRQGERIAGRYRLDERLGRGGMGEVWRGYDLQLGRPIALKLLVELDAAAELLERFRREASIGAQFQHPGITVVHDIGQHENRLFIVMELLEGEDLARALARSPAGLPIAEAVDLAAQAAVALAATHARDVVHRDLKPANLFRLTDGRLKICDFGIARGVQVTQQLTRTGWMLGTPPYMAPEQWRGKDIDTRSDLYALGCVLHELLVGAPPFPAEGHPLALMHRHFDEKPAALRSIRSEVPVDLEALIAELLAKNPDARPDASATAARLHAIQHSAVSQIAPLDRSSAPIGLGSDSATETAAPTPSRRGDTATPAGLRRPRRRSIILGGAAALVTASGATLIGLRLADDTSPAPHLWFTLTGHTGVVSSVAFSPDSKTLVSGSFDGNFRLWDLATRTSTATPVGHNDAPISMVLSLDGKTLASADTSNVVRLWDFATRTSTAALKAVGPMNEVAFSPDGKTLASGGGEGSWAGGDDKSVVQLWDLATRTSTATLTDKSQNVGSLAFSPNGKTLAAYTGAVQLWDLATRTSTATLTDKSQSVRSLAFSPNGKTLATGNDDKTVQLWDLATRTSTAALTGHTDSVSSVAFSPDGKTLASGSDDRTIRLWDLATRTSTSTLTGHTDSVRSVAFSPDGKTLASSSVDKTVRLWKLS